MADYRDHHKYDPFRKPSWRFEQVLKIIDNIPAPKRSSKWSDAFVLKAKQFVLKYRSCSEEKKEYLFGTDPGLYYAYKIYERADEHPELPLFIEARLLARQSFETIAKHVATLPDTIAWYERLFFNVVDRLDNRDWITKFVLLPSLMKNRFDDPFADQGMIAVQDARADVVALPFMDASLKLFAYFGGEILVDTMITGFQAGDIVKQVEEIPGWFDRQFSNTIRRRSAQAALQFKITKYNVTELFRVHTEIMNIERMSDTSEAVKTATEAHISGLLSELPLVTGKEGKVLIQKTRRSLTDTDAVELTSQELLAAGLGEDVELPDMPDKMPEAKKKKLKSDVVTETVLEGIE